MIALSPTNPLCYIFTPPDVAPAKKTQTRRDEATYLFLSLSLCLVCSDRWVAMLSFSLCPPTRVGFRIYEWTTDVYNCFPMLLKLYLS